ncbi:MAG: 1,2-phenylacetyl-CoA epoxidase subunit PaaD [Myxococcota bacterium]
MVATAQSANARDLWECLEDVPDPELPSISIVALGIVRTVERREDGSWAVVITPTYSGCPAMGAIAEDITTAVDAAVSAPCTVEVQLSPPWTTDWIREDARQEMQRNGIVPPALRAAGRLVPIRAKQALECPRCGSRSTERVSRFGATACKSLHRCLECLEPFEHFKAI